MPSRTGDRTWSIIHPNGTSTASGKLPHRVGRYVLLGEIARGGMGVVLRAHDPELGRALAIKVLLDDHQNNPALLRRFIEEAQIAGQLQHPGIVPIHELAYTDEDRPFFTMRLVEGQTLATLLARRSTPADNLPRFLSVFLQICQTLAYAHDRKVIHRDLKPSNIMVGNFGEVQVMDWGLAKIIGTPEQNGPPAQANPGTVRTDTVGDQTQVGLVLGTPDYMAPEQARGGIDLDERCDVFGLGAILCEILSGHPPFLAPFSEVSLEMAARGDLRGALSRLQQSEADPELISLAQDCLAPAPAERPPSAGAVAERVMVIEETWRQRLREAELERAAAAARFRADRRVRRLRVSRRRS